MTRARTKSTVSLCLFGIATDAPGRRHNPGAAQFFFLFFFFCFFFSFSEHLPFSQRLVYAAIATRAARLHVIITLTHYDRATTTAVPTLTTRPCRRTCVCVCVYFSLLYIYVYVCVCVIVDRARRHGRCRPGWPCAARAENRARRTTGATRLTALCCTILIINLRLSLFKIRFYRLSCVLGGLAASRTAAINSRSGAASTPAGTRASRRTFRWTASDRSPVSMTPTSSCAPWRTTGVATSG